MKLFKKILITGKLQLVTGLHIGDSKESVEIGGVDSPVVRRKDNNEPYIPGSSLKGKMRALLEIATGSNADSKFRKGDYSDEGKMIPELFGSAGDDGTPSRILVRDAYLTRDWSKKLYESEFTDMPYTEIKFENVINRIKGTAEHPRQIERIPAGAEFEIEFVINIIADNEQTAKSIEMEYVNLFSSGIRLLEDDYLGGSGTRGYGKVKFQLKDPTPKMINEYFIP